MIKVSLFLVTVFFMTLEICNAAPIDEAKVLYNQNKFEDARARLAEIFETDPENVEAKYYNALCALGEGDENKFLNSVEKLKSRYKELTMDQCESMDKTYIALSFKKRDFADVNAHANDFLTSYPQTKHESFMKSVKALSSFEVGYKKVWNSKNWTFMRPQEESPRNWDYGTGRLRDFLDAQDEVNLNVASELYDNPTRFMENTWKAHVILRNETQLLEDMQGENAVVQEAFYFIRTRTHIEIFPGDTEQIFESLQEYNQIFPDSWRRHQLEHKAAGIFFRRGNGLMKQSQMYKTQGRQEEAELDRLESLLYLSLYRELCDVVLLDSTSTSGMSENDRDELISNYLYSLDMEERFPELREKSRQIALEYPKGSRTWARGKIYQAISYHNTIPANYSRAAQLLDEVIAEEVADPSVQSHSYHVPTDALWWRLSVARKMGDDQKYNDIADRIKMAPESLSKKGALALMDIYRQND